GDAVLPAELPGVAHEDHGGEVAGAVGEGGEPGAYAPPAQDEAADVGGVAAAVEADAHHDGKEYDQKGELDHQVCHLVSPHFLCRSHRQLESFALRRE